MNSFAAIITFVLLTITLAPLLPSNHWIVRDWEFPRVQISILLFTNILICIGLLLSEPVLILSIFIAISGLCLAYQLYWVIPYTPLFPKQVAQVTRYQVKNSIGIMTSNVLMTNRDYGRLIELVNDIQPDILVTLETDKRWQEALSSLKKDYPYCVERPLDNLYGIHLFSRLKLRNIEVREMIEDGVPSIHCEVQMANDIWVRCHFLHPAPPSPTENTKSTQRDIELALVAKEVEGEQLPIIVTGDLNDVAWSPTTRKFRFDSGLLDPRIGRGMFNTFHADYPFIRWPLDHLFHSDEFRLAEIRRLPSIGSDHFPLYTKLVYSNQ